MLATTNTRSNRIGSHDDYVYGEEDGKREEEEEQDDDYYYDYDDDQ